MILDEIVCINWHSLLRTFLASSYLFTNHFHWTHIWYSNQEGQTSFFARPQSGKSINRREAYAIVLKLQQVHYLIVHRD